MKNVISFKTIAILIFLISIFSSKAQDTTATTELIIPCNDFNYISSYTTFCWYKVNNTEVYRIQYSKNQNMSDSIVIKANDTSFYFEKPLGLNTIYYWKIQSEKYKQGNNIEWISNWSETWKFQTNREYLLSPNLDYAIPVTKDIYNFRWYKVPGTKNYLFQLAKEYNIRNKYFDTLTSETRNLNFKSLNRQKYYSRVLAKKENYTSEFSEIKILNVGKQFFYEILCDFLLSPPKISTKQFINEYLIWTHYIEEGYTFNYQVKSYKGNNIMHLM